MINDKILRIPEQMPRRYKKGLTPVRKSTGRFVCPNCGYALTAEEMRLLMVNIECPICRRFRRDDFREEYTFDYEPIVFPTSDEV